MKRLLLTLLATITFGIANSQILYQISGNGLKKCSYIIGSCHYINKSFIDSIPGANKILGQVEQVCGELETKYMQDKDTMNAVAKMIMMPGDSTIKSIMTNDQFEKFAFLVKKHYNIDINQPLFTSILKLRPIGIQITLPQLAEMMKSPTEAEKMNPENLMDSYFQTEAAKNNKPTIGLESYLYQMNMLVDAASGTWQEQIEDLLDWVEKYDENLLQTESVIEAYKNQDISKIAQITTESFDSTTTDIDNRLLYNVTKIGQKKCLPLWQKNQHCLL